MNASSFRVSWSGHPRSKGLNAAPGNSPHKLQIFWILAFFVLEPSNSAQCYCFSQETWVLSLGWDNPPEEEMETHSSILTWEIPWTEKPGALQSMGHKE